MNSPLLSREAKDIMKNMNDVELSLWKIFARKEGAKYGIICGLVCAITPQLLQVFFDFHFLTDLVITVVISVTFGWILATPIRSKTKTLLCNTCYAKNLSIVPQSLRLYAFEPHKKA
jgi:hypothetical protein